MAGDQVITAVCVSVEHHNTIAASGESQLADRVFFLRQRSKNVSRESTIETNETFYERACPTTVFNHHRRRSRG